MSISPLSSAIARPRSTPAARRCSSRSRARRPIRSPRCAIAARKGSTFCRSSMCASRRSRGNPMPFCRRSPGPRSASPRPRPSPASSRCSPAWPLPPARRAGVIGPALEAELVQALGEVPRLMATVLRDERPYEALAQWLSKARDVLYLGRGLSYPDRARRRAQAERDLLYPRRRLCRGRAEAWADRADRREHAGHRHRAARRPLR